jgi:hypothetical protein
MPTQHTDSSIVVRLKKQDTPIGISRDTLDDLATQLNISKTEVMHMALREMADRYSVPYDLEGGQLKTEAYVPLHSLPEESLTPDQQFFKNHFEAWL